MNGSGVRAPSSESLDASVSYALGGGTEGSVLYILTFKVILRDRELANVKGSMTDLAMLNYSGCGGEGIVRPTAWLFGGGSEGCGGFCSGGVGRT